VGNSNDHFVKALKQMMAATLHNCIGEFEQAEASAASALELSEKNKFPEVASLARINLGYARAELGQATEGVVLIRKGIEGVGNNPGLTRLMTWLAVAHERAGSLADALETVERALGVNPDALLTRPEALRMRGELQLKKGQAELAKADFRDSIALARNMGAKVWELRTTMSLARMLASQGRRDEAHSMLAEIYTWFTEGFDTADLREAKALLEELAT